MSTPFLIGYLTNHVRLSKEISSGINGFACGEPWERLKPKEKVFRLSSFKHNVIAEALTLCNSH